VSKPDPFGSRARFQAAGMTATMYRLDRLEKAGLGVIARLPFTIRVLLEVVLRNCDGTLVTEDDVRAVAAWSPAGPPAREVPFQPARIYK